MPTERPGEPWLHDSYRGFSGPRPEPEPPPARPRRWPEVRRNQMILGAAIAVALGLALGLWARPGGLKTGAGPALDEDNPARPGVPIEVEHPPPPIQPRSAGKLQVLPPGMAPAPRAAVAPQTTAVQPPPGMIEAPSSRTVSESPAAQPPLRVPAPASANEPAAPRPRASFDCATARPGAEQIVCSDPVLAADDRELAGAYRRALQSGAAPPGALRADQRDWMAIREDAARHSRRALDQVYRQRIDELNGIAEESDSDEGGPRD